jgi:hypothetical protein
MTQGKTGWKWAVALFSLILTILIWRQGLQESFDRPSVAPKISLMQTEMSVSAASSLPESFKDVFLGLEPQEKLYQALNNISPEQLDDRQRLLLAALEKSDNKRKIILKEDFKETNFQAIRKYLLDKEKG